MAPILEAVVTGVAGFMSEIPKRPVQPAYRLVGAARLREIGMSVFTAKLMKPGSELFELSSLIPVRLMMFEGTSVMFHSTDELARRFGQVCAAQGMVEITMHVFRGLFELISRVHHALLLRRIGLPSMGLAHTQ
jgi:hypothetical protein